MSHSGDSLKLGTYVGVSTVVSLGLFFFMKMRKRSSQANRFSSEITVRPHREGWHLTNFGNDSNELGSHPEGPNLGFESNETWYNQTAQKQRRSASVKTDLLHTGHRKGGKLLICMVGLPGSGKTLIARKVARYLRWIAYRTKTFSIAKYRLDKLGSKTADFFNQDNEGSYNQRLVVMNEALEDSLRYLHRGGEIAILDGTNSSRDRRDMIRARVSEEDGYELFWIESACDFFGDSDASVRGEMLRTLRKSPDFISIEDYEKRCAHYKSNYCAVADDEGSFIRIHDKFSKFTLHNTQGFLPSKIVSFVVNLKPGFRAVHFCRHGESTFNARGLIGGDGPLSPKGQSFARALGEYVSVVKIGGSKSSRAGGNGKDYLHVWTSCLRRAKETASHLLRDTGAQSSSNDSAGGNGDSGDEKGSSDGRLSTHSAASTMSGRTSRLIEWRALNDIEVGICDGLSYEQISHRFPDEYRSRSADKLTYRYPRGESYLDVIARLEPVIFELERGEEELIIVSHQAVLRCLYAYFLDLPAAEIPFIDIPLHTVICLQPMTYGCKEKRTKINVEADAH